LVGTPFEVILIIRRMFYRILFHITLFFKRLLFHIRLELIGSKSIFESALESFGLLATLAHGDTVSLWRKKSLLN
jgi:hypothetical protein